MKWVKKGLIYGPNGSSPWAKHTALQPTPWVRPDGTIRIFAGFRDNSGVSRVGYIDVSGTNPAKVLKVSPKPVLDIGTPGTFDDNGVVPCAVVRRSNKLFLYYAGYQLTLHVRFLALAGLAISHDQGNSFTRYSNVPILERTEREYLFRAVHSIIFDKGKWRVWYGGGNHFIRGKNKTLPIYDIRYMESKDGIHFPTEGKTVVPTRRTEYRVGRPYVRKTHSGYEMYFGYSTKSIPYRLTYATSHDGIRWKRNDAALKLEYGKNDFDSTMSAYPAVVTVSGNTYLFYNGNDYGKMGIGYAIQTPGTGK